jgi:TonB family protein
MSDDAESRTDLSATPPAQLVSPEAMETQAEPTEPLRIVGPAAIDLPTPPSFFTRADLTSLLVAIGLHAAIAATMVVPEHRIGALGRTPDAIGVDLIVLAAALDGHITDSEKAKRSALGPAPRTPGQTGDTSATTESAPAPDLRRSTTLPSATPPQPKATEKETPEPVSSPDAAPSPSPPRSETTAPSQLNSAPAEASDTSSAGQPGQITGRAVDVTTAALALARAGRRDRYAARIFAALKNNLPQHIAGARAKVSVEFTITSTGQPEQVRIALSSGNDAIDQAALQAVRSTEFPSPPPELAPSDLVYSMEYTFADEPTANDATVAPAR